MRYTGICTVNNTWIHCFDSIGVQLFFPMKTQLLPFLETRRSMLRGKLPQSHLDSQKNEGVHQKIVGFSWESDDKSLDLEGYT